MEKVMPIAIATAPTCCLAWSGFMLPFLFVKIARLNEGMLERLP